jgi:predicted DNA-binding transcriptional regulator AlpA
MTRKEELIRKVQGQRRFLDDLLTDIAGLQEPAPPQAETPRREVGEDRLMNARDIQAFLGIKPATFYDWLKKGILPPGENFGGCTRTKRWRKSAITASLAGRKEAAE